MRVGHCVGGFDDAGKRGDVGRLFADLVVHVADQGLIGEDDGRDAHRPGGLDAPRRGVDLRQTIGVHGGILLQTSTTHAADQTPSRSAATFKTA